MRARRVIDKGNALIARTIDSAKSHPFLAFAALACWSGMLVLFGMLLPAGTLYDHLLSRLQQVGRLPGVDDVRQFEWTSIRSALHDLEMTRVPIGTFGGGGGIEGIDDGILFATPTGFIGYLGKDNNLRYLPLRVPMRFEALVESEPFNLPNFTREWFRVLDLLVVEREAQSYDLYVSHHRFMDDCVAVVLSKIGLRKDGEELVSDSGDWSTVYSARPCIPFYYEGIEVFSGQVGGGRLQQLSDTELLMSTGDHSFDGVHTPGEAYSQDPNNDLGKLLKISLVTGAVEVLASGMRNPQGLIVGRDGRIWETEHGPRGGDELNLIVPGANYGWPEVTLGKTYENTHWPKNPNPGRHLNYKQPVFAFVPSIGISNLVEVDGLHFPYWDGDLLVSSLAGRTLYRIRLNGDVVQYAEPIPIGERIRDIFVRRDGQLVALSDDGFLVFIRNAEDERDRRPIEISGLAVLPSIEAETFKGWKNPNTPVGRGRAVFARACQSCHAVVESNGIGPHLKGIVGREVGSTEGYPYSGALAESTGRWSERLMRSYLLDPQSTFPGTTMVAPGLGDGQIDDVIAYLSSIE